MSSRGNSFANGPCMVTGPDDGSPYSRGWTGPRPVTFWDFTEGERS